MLPENFRHKISLQTRFSDVDMLGHVNHARYLTYLEEGRIHYAFDVLQWSGEGQDIGMIVVKVVFDYLLPLHVNEVIQVYTRCARIGRKSFDLSYLVTRDNDKAIVGSGLTTMVSYDYARQSSVLMSEAWKTSILEYEVLQPESN